MNATTRHLLVAALLLVVTACSPTPPSADGAPSAPAASPASSPVAGAPRPIIVTTDMGMDDLLAVYILLRDPAVDVRAIAIDGTGLVHCGPGLRNIRRILVAFGRPDIPFACGRDDAGPDGTPFPDEWRAVSDNMYGIVLPPVVGTEFPPQATTLLADAIAAAPSPVTIVALGPWTTLEDLFAAAPETRSRVAGIHAMAGAIDVPGNMVAAGITTLDRVEWNVGADPNSVAAVLALDVPVSLVPLDATNDVPVPATILSQLEADHTAAGADITFETYARSPDLAGEGNYWWDGTAAASLTDPSLLTWEDATVSINEHGRIERDGAGRAVRIATGADTGRTQAAILAGLRRGAPRPDPFIAVAAISVTWDGTTCRVDGDAPTAAGLTRVTLSNRSAAPVGMMAAEVVPPRTWTDALDWVATVDLSDENLQIPDWIRPIEGNGPFSDAGVTSTALITLPAGVVGLACASGEWPDFDVTSLGAFTLSD